MKKKTSKLMAVFAAFILFVGTVFCPIDATASEKNISWGNGSFEPYCEHDYSAVIDTGSTCIRVKTDVCNKCGAVRIHYTKYDIPFVTINENTELSPDCYNNSCSSIIPMSITPIRVIGRVRNQKNELMLLLDNESYVNADKVAFDFDSALSMFYDDKAFREKDAIKKLNYIYKEFKSGGTYDWKDSCLLGATTYYYPVYVSGRTLDTRYTGEMIGNSFYGACLTKMGIPEDLILIAGGAGPRLSLDTLIKIAACLIDADGYLCNQWSNSEEYKKVLECFNGDNFCRCDSEEDKREIRRGVFYASNDYWDEAD